MSREPRCRCGSGRLYRRCCGPLHEGAAARTPEALMRSRYAAYALGRIDYIIDTTEPGSPAWREEGSWREEIRRFVEQTRFVGLRVLDAPEPVGDEGFVEFEAWLEQGGQKRALSERSRFVRTDGRWRYHSGIPGVD